MSSSGDVTILVNQLKAGDQEAVQKLWEKYFRRLVGLARARLRAIPRTAADEEDVALSAFDSLCRRARAGKFPQLDDRKDLWTLLFLIVRRKVCDLIQHEQRERRDWRLTRSVDGEEAPVPLSAEPDPAMVLEMAEVLERRLASLPDELSMQIARLTLEGYTQKEIAEKLKPTSLATVERKLKNIRAEWKEVLKNPDE